MVHSDALVNLLTQRTKDILSFFSPLSLFFLFNCVQQPPSLNSTSEMNWWFLSRKNEWMNVTPDDEIFMKWKEFCTRKSWFEFFCISPKNSSPFQNVGFSCSLKFKEFKQEMIFTGQEKVSRWNLINVGINLELIFPPVDLECFS